MEVERRSETGISGDPAHKKGRSAQAAEPASRRRRLRTPTATAQAERPCHPNSTSYKPKMLRPFILNPEDGLSKHTPTRPGLRSKGRTRDGIGTTPRMPGQTGGMMSGICLKTRKPRCSWILRSQTIDSEGLASSVFLVKAQGHYAYRPIFTPKAKCLNGSGTSDVDSCQMARIRAPVSALGI